MMYKKNASYHTNAYSNVVNLNTIGYINIVKINTWVIWESDERSYMTIFRILYKP